jgi:hypothetical protein
MASEHKKVTLQELQKIVADAGGPEIKDTFNARCLVVSTNCLMHNKQMKPFELPPELKACKEALAKLSKHLPAIEKGYQEHEKRWQELTGDEEEETSKKSARIRRLIAAIENVQPAISFKIRRQGQHDPAVPYSNLRDIYERLFWAWGEAGHSPPTQEIAAEAIAALARRAGINVQADSLRKKIDVKAPPCLPPDHPQRLRHWKSAAEMRRIGDSIRVPDAPDSA